MVTEQKGRIPALKRSLCGTRPPRSGSCNWAAPSPAVCFERASFMPETMPALSAAPSRKQWRGRGPGVVTAASDSRFSGRDNGDSGATNEELPTGSRTGEARGRDAGTCGPGRPPVAVTPHFPIRVLPQGSTLWAEGPHLPPLRWHGDREVTRGTTKPSLPFLPFTSLTLSPD